MGLPLSGVPNWSSSCLVTELACPTEAGRLVRRETGAMAKELLIRALRGERVAPIPWLPHIGTHAAQLLGVSAQQYLQDAELLARGRCSARTGIAAMASLCSMTQTWKRLHWALCLIGQNKGRLPSFPLHFPGSQQSNSSSIFLPCPMKRQGAGLP